MLHVEVTLFLCFFLRTLGQNTFPTNFEFGVATSAYQIEGGWSDGGKGVSVWDKHTQSDPHLIADGSNGNIACDSYHKWEEDIKMIKYLGCDFYRFSLSWTRLIPDGSSNNVSLAGVDFYNKLINALIDNGIKPVVTIFHWDLPQILSSLGGWSNRLVVKWFANYARTVFSLFGDRVKTWITINEPRVFCQKFLGSVGDIVDPFPLGIIEYLCSQNVLLAHAEAYHIYDKEFRFKQKGEISITLDCTWFEPENASNPADVAAANRKFQFQFGLYAHPIFFYDYPKVVITEVERRSKLEGFSSSRLPQLSLHEKAFIRGTYDFLGINHYITYFVKQCNEPPIGKPDIAFDAGGNDCKYQDPTWEDTGRENFKVVPWGLRNLLKFIKENYGNPRIYITENGYPDNTEILEDDKRVNYFRKYLNATLQAIYEDGVRVEKYTAWTLMDNFEWNDGYTQKFGLYYVNFTDPERPRIPKKSVEYYKNVTTTKTI